MIVSILQLMGFPMAKPVHSRAEESPPTRHSKADQANQVTNEHAQASSARRQQVNPKTVKDKQVKAKPGKAPAKLPASKLASSSKAAEKPVAKAGKTAKPQPKPVAKAAAKPVAKAAAKPAAKPVSKAGTAKAQVKPAAKAAAKAPAKAPAKAAAKAGAERKMPAKPKPQLAVKPAPKAAKPVVQEKTPIPMPTVANKSPVIPASPAPKPGRPSSRLAQLTVPSMAQAVASTAAKASYSQSAPTQLIVPVLPSSIKKDPKLANNWKTRPIEELTDADLMAMPDTEYMNEVQMAAFRLKLTRLKQGILNSAGETTEHLREDTSVVPDPADRATIEEEHALELRTRDRERKLLKKIEQSIARIDAGDYGYCDETGEPIGVGRLLARPTATLSLEAQQRRELKQKMFGD